MVQLCAELQHATLRRLARQAIIERRYDTSEQLACCSSAFLAFDKRLVAPALDLETGAPWIAVSGDDVTKAWTSCVACGAA